MEWWLSSLVPFHRINFWACVLDLWKIRYDRLAPGPAQEIDRLYAKATSASIDALDAIEVAWLTSLLAERYAWELEDRVRRNLNAITMF